ncbi:alpha-(1,3)-fucosyltransferase 7-like [Engraulis encrasicolus]|uniref:alpha-(1,3)-fucosyltransferase 7-like n=1 Tax=Engraulis encrasicolus TaxID=184585 RepID=UPI002FD31F78
MLDLCRRRKVLAIIIFFCLFGNLLLLIFRRPSILNRFLQHEAVESQSLPVPGESQSVPVKMKNTTVLVWYWAFGIKQHWEGDVCKDRYGIPNCILSDDRSLFPQADFIVFHNRELINRQERLPEHLARPPNQAWVWFSRESPAYNGDTRFLAGKFNYTIFYRRDADFFNPFGYLVPRNSTGMTLDDFIPKEKSYLACWVVGHYAAGHERTKLYLKLKQVIPIEWWGAAAHRGLHGDLLLPTMSHCYFYLSFENSIFRDYISEKVWRNAFQSGAVPVVLGPPRKNYEEMLPEGSFIHVNDFKNVAELGEFLKKLAEDKERYASYFKWKLNYTVETFMGNEHWLVEPFCRICTKQSTIQRPKVYKDLHGWQWK